MNKFILIFIIIHSYSTTLSQTATIFDKDGWSNIRKNPNLESEVVHKVYNNDVFWYEPSSDTKDKWTKVYIPKNKYSFGVTTNEFIVGFIHNSRIIQVSNLPKCTDKNFTFEYTISDFEKEMKIIDYNQDDFLYINGLPIWGTDGNLPKTQVDSIHVSIDGKTININPLFYSDIFECDNNFEIYFKDDCYFVNQWNSDGAGGYQITWVFTLNGLKQRLVGTMI